jgi:hypothetical protein
VQLACAKRKSRSPPMASIVASPRARSRSPSVDSGHKQDMMPTTRSRSRSVSVSRSRSRSPSISRTGDDKTSTENACDVALIECKNAV